MSDELVAKLLGDLEAIPQTVPFVLCPFLINEPFSDRRLESILEAAERRLPHATVFILTTGTLLDPGRIARLQERSNIDRLVVSLNFTCAVDYEAQMSLPWERTIANLQELHRRFAAGLLRFPVVLSRVASDDHRDEEFRAFVGQRFPGFGARILARHDWLGRVPAPLRDLDAVPCTEWYDLKVAATGLVTLCCQDSHGEHILGDATVTPLLDIYNQPWARDRRRDLASRSRYSPCKGCSYLGG